jgi:tetratricopeptide (TPR) repeat protein
MRKKNSTKKKPAFNKKIELENKFFEGSRALLHKNYGLAKYHFEEIANVGGNFKYLSGTYVNLAKIEIETNSFQDQESLLKAEQYIKKALEIKPENQQAMVMAITLYIFKRDICNTISYYLELTDSAAITYSSNLMGVLQQIILEQDVTREVIEAVEKLYNSNKKHAAFAVILANAYLAINEGNKSYFIYRSFLEHSPKDLFILNNLSLLCSSLNLGEEAVEHALKGLEILDGYRKNGQTILVERYKDLSNVLLSNLGTAYVQLNESNKVIELLAERVISNPNNTDLSNLAFAYFKLDEFQQALAYCDKALLISVDEQCLLLKAECLYLLENYEEATVYYKKALSIIEEDTILEFAEPSGETRKSYIFNSKLTKKDIYINLIHGYIAAEEYVSAKAVVNLALGQYPNESQMKKLDRNIDSFIKLESNQEKIKQKTKELEDDLIHQKRKLNEEKHEIREWAINLLKLQNSQINGNDVESEDDWRSVVKQLHDIAIIMKESVAHKADYDQIKKELKEKFPSISNDALTFLATGEFLFNVHYESTIDFAPVMVEYSKVIECELNRLLKQKGLVTGDQNLTLGQMKYQMDKFRISSIPELSKCLTLLIKYRNGSAHTGFSTKAKVQKIRNLIIHEGFLQSILNSF